MRWEKFLDGLASAGGNIILMSIMVIFFASSLLIITVISILHPGGITESTITTFKDVLMMFGGALVNAFTQRFRAQGGGEGDNGTRTSTMTETSSTTSATPPPGGTT